MTSHELQQLITTRDVDNCLMRLSLDAKHAFEEIYFERHFKECGDITLLLERLVRNKRLNNCAISCFSV